MRGQTHAAKAIRPAVEREQLVREGKWVNRNGAERNVVDACASGTLYKALTSYVQAAASAVRTAARRDFSRHQHVEITYVRQPAGAASHPRKGGGGITTLVVIVCS